MAVNLHRCSLLFFKLDAHPCHRVQKALDEQGIDYEIVKEPLTRGSRDWVQQATGQRHLPVIEFEDGTIYRAQSAEMAARISAGELGTTA
jgi:glutaredoxin